MDCEREGLKPSYLFFLKLKSICHPGKQLLIKWDSKNQSLSQSESGFHKVLPIGPNASESLWMRFNNADSLLPFQTYRTRISGHGNQKTAFLASSPWELLYPTKLKKSNIEERSLSLKTPQHCLPMVLQL